jgi:pyridoxine kinase
MSAPAILSIQSEVVYGHVGHGAARFALQKMGFEVLALPAVLLSNHPGHGGAAGEAIPAAALKTLLAGLAQRGFLDGVAGVLSGYLGAAEQAAVVAEAVQEVKRRNRTALYLCDPVFGDDDGAYARPGVAEAMARRLVPMADIVAPNRFELASLTARQVADGPSARAAAAALGRPEVLATSVPGAAGEIGTLACQGPRAWSAGGPRRENPPHGTGDLLAALYLGLRAQGLTPPEALGRAAAPVHALIEEAGRLALNELPLIARQDLLTGTPPLPVTSLD